MAVIICLGVLEKLCILVGVYDLAFLGHGMVTVNHEFTSIYMPELFSVSTLRHLNILHYSVLDQLLNLKRKKNKSELTA